MLMSTPFERLGSKVETNVHTDTIWEFTETPRIACPTLPAPKSRPLLPPPETFMQTLCVCRFLILCCNFWEVIERTRAIHLKTSGNFNSACSRIPNPITRWIHNNWGSSNLINHNQHSRVIGIWMVSFWPLDPFQNSSWLWPWIERGTKA